VVATELKTDIFEEPDAIGWGACSRSILVECKASRADFFADKKKNRAGVGLEKWYMTPRGLVKPCEVPDGWGLVEYRESNHSRGYYVKVVKPLPKMSIEDYSKVGDANRLQVELRLLVSIAARSLQALSLVGRLGVGDGELDEQF
jgi:hypothetical protein